MSLRRARGRRRRQQELLYQRTGAESVDWSWLGLFFTFILMAVINCGYAFAIDFATVAGERIDAKRSGTLFVSSDFKAEVIKAAHVKTQWVLPASEYDAEAEDIAQRIGGSKADIARQLRIAVAFRGSAGLASESVVAAGLSALPRASATAAMLGSLVFLWWCLTMVFQGEGLELDVQRRRHPMWEWLFSHPVSPSAVFGAEML